MKPDASAAPDASVWNAVPRLTLPAVDDPLASVLRMVSLVILKHPVAAQAAFAALVAEGRRFAQTPEGRWWKAALANSELAERGRALWEASMLHALEDSSDVVLPTAVVDAVVQAVSRTDLESALLRCLRADSGGEEINAP